MLITVIYITPIHNLIFFVDHNYLFLIFLLPSIASSKQDAVQIQQPMQINITNAALYV